MSQSTPAFLAAFAQPGAYAFLVHIDPTQTYFPKISSRVTASGSMESNPLHRMTPDLDEATAARVFRYIPADHADASPPFAWRPVDLESSQPHP